jgi:hypothetical protein
MARAESQDVTNMQVISTQRVLLVLLWHIKQITQSALSAELHKLQGGGHSVALTIEATPDRCHV